MTAAHESYTAWLAAEIQAAIDDPRPSVPHDEVMARMGAKIADMLAIQQEKRTAQQAP